MDKTSFIWGKKKPAEKPVEKLTPTTNNPPYDPLHQQGKTVGRAGAVMDLSRMLEFLLKEEQIFSQLPRKLQDGIRKVFRMTQDPFKYATDEDSSEREAFFGEDPNTRLRSLKDTLTKTLHGGDLPKKVMDALLDAQSVIDREMTPEEQKTPSPREQRREERNERQREKEMGRHQEKQDVQNREDEALETLKRMFGRSVHYKNVYNALPVEIRKELDKLSMDPENIKYLFSSRAVFASRSVIERYLDSLK